MNKCEKKLEQEESTLLSTMARVPSKSNFSINRILEINQHNFVERNTPAEGSPAPSAESDADNISTDGDVNVDYESDMEEGKHQMKE